MKFRILAYLFFFVGIADLFIKIFYGNIFSELTEDYYEIANPILVFTPVLFFSIGGIFLKESKVSLTLENFGTSRIKYYSPQFICLSVVVLIFLFFTFNAQVNMVGLCCCIIKYIISCSFRNYILYNYRCHCWYS